MNHPRRPARAACVPAARNGGMAAERFQKQAAARPEQMRSRLEIGGEIAIDDVRRDRVGIARRRVRQAPPCRLAVRERRHVRRLGVSQTVGRSMHPYAARGQPLPRRLPAAHTS